MRDARRRPSWLLLTASAAGALALVLTMQRHASSQMVSSGATDQPARPLPPGMRAPAVDFRDVAANAGLTAVIVSGDEEQTTVVENTGTGVAIFDYDNDGLPDIFFVQGDRLKPGQTPLTPHLYHNLGGLRFEDVTAKAGIGHTGWGQGVCAGDVDNDGYVDLFITQWGHNVFLHNMGNGTFRDETRERGLDRPAPRWSTGCAFVDYDRDGWLDLVVANYIDFAAQQTPRPRERSGCKWKGIAVPCGPRGLKGETMTLYHNDGHGRFTDVTKQAGFETPPQYYGFTVLTGDFDNDGWPDIFIACDSTPSLYFHNKRNGTFEEIGLISGLAVNEDGREQAGMGATAGDYDGDGYLDIFKTNFSSDTNTLYRNLGDGTFSDVTSRAGLAVQTRYVKWGAAFVDIDNDGWKDLFVVAGHVYPFVGQYGLGEEFHQPRALYWNRGDGQFFDASSRAGPGVAARHSSRGLAVGDLDNDGSEEIVIVNLFEPPSLLKNFGPRGNALLVRALTASGRDAIGARVTVTSQGRRQVDEVRSGGYHISQGDFRVHFGLGSASHADVSIRWPQGATETFKDIAANQLIVAREGKGIIDRRPFAGCRRRLDPTLGDAMAFYAAACQTDFPCPKTRAEIAARTARMCAMIEQTIVGYEPFFEVRLLAFPEFAHAAPIYETPAELRKHLAVPVPNEHTTAYERLARKYGCYIQSGTFIETDPDWPGAVFNTTVLIGAKGVLLKYRKVNPWIPWEVHASPHDLPGYDKEPFPVAQTELGRIGVAICYDWLFPETIRQLAFNGAEILVRVSAYMDPWGATPPMDWWTLFNRARAAENTAYVVAANQGAQFQNYPPFSWPGGSMIVDYDGRILAQADPGPGEKVVVAPIDVAALRAERARRVGHDMRAHLRSELHTYMRRGWLGPGGAKPLDKARITRRIRDAKRRLPK